MLCHYGNCIALCLDLSRWYQADVHQPSEIHKDQSSNLPTNKPFSYSQEFDLEKLVSKARLNDAHRGLKAPDVDPSAN